MEAKYLHCYIIGLEVCWPQAVGSWASEDGVVEGYLQGWKRLQTLCHRNMK